MNLIEILLILALMVSRGRSANESIPLGGNAFITDEGKTQADPAKITDSGLQNWKDPKTTCSIYFKLTQTETFDLKLRLYVPSGRSTIQVVIKGDPTMIIAVRSLHGSEYFIKHIGRYYTVPPGYVRVDLKGLNRTGSTYGVVSHVLLSGLKGRVDYIRKQENFYYGRRGPSVHLEYISPGSYFDQYNYFYSEVMIPKGNDVVGSYFMANGFDNGYFGIQVNSKTERRVLFSVFSDYNSDDPKAVPNDYMVRVLGHGQNVTVQDFGNEGSGKQAFIIYPWKTDVTYKFLVFGAPEGKNNNLTKHIAWFKSPGSDWLLMAKYIKPKISIYLTGLYAFLENFKPEQGYITRRGHYGNQWVKQANNGTWKEIIRAKFTSDPTAMEGRDDYAGGVAKGKQFYLMNCGFFDQNVEVDKIFKRNPTNAPPKIDFSKLP